MDLTISTNHTTITDAIRSYAEKRLSKLDRRFREPVPVQLMLRREETKSAADRYIAEVTIKLKRGLIRSEERGDSPYTAIDLVEETVDRRIRKYKTKYERRRRGASGFEREIAEQLAAEAAAAGVPDEAEQVKELEGGRLVRTKQHPVAPITVEEAAVQMDLLGHNFYMFRNSESHEINVVYRRHDNDYGLIVPEEPD